MNINTFAYRSGRTIKEDNTVVNIGDRIASMSIVQAISITPNDIEDLTNATTAIFVGVDGDLKVTLVGGQTVVLKNLAAGMWHPICAARVFATGTTATDILGAW